MRYDIIYTTKYALIVSDEPKKDMEYCLANSEDGIYNNSIVRFSTSPCPPPSVTNKSILKKIVAHRPLDGKDFLDGVIDLPSFPVHEADDVEQLAESLYGTDVDSIRGGVPYDLEADRKNGFVRGYNKAREKYEFTQEDMEACFMAARHNIVRNQFKYDSALDYLQHLEQSKMPVAFELLTEEVGGEMVEGNDSDGELVWHERVVPVTEYKDGRHIAIGKYIYANK